jgi:hypothetical protein
VPRRANNPTATALPRRQVWLFLVAVLTPCLVLIGLSLRTLEQERQLQEKRSADERQRRLAQLRQELSNHLDRVSLDLALSASVPPDERKFWGQATQPRNSPSLASIRFA